MQKCLLTIFVCGAFLAGSRGVLADGPFLLNAQQATFATRPEYLRDHFHHIDALPFDGLIISSDTGRTLMAGTAQNAEQMTRDFAPLNGLVFTRARHNFALVNVDRPADFFGDWSATIENFRAFARVIRTAGLAGIFLDNEEYQRTLFNYPEDCGDPSRPLAEYLAQARWRGRQIMQAMAAEFPEMVTLVAHGPYSSFEGTPEAVHRGQTHWDAEELRGAFSAGLIEGLDSRGRFVDGGELYAYRSAEDFQISYDFRKTFVASAEADCPYLPGYLRGVWPLKVGVGFGVYSQPYQDQPMSPAILRTTLEEALRRCDEYVWLYAEEVNWNAPGEISPAWVDAVIGARLAVSDLPATSSSWISLTSPAEGAVYLAPENILLTAQGGANVRKVEFFADEIKVGEATESPFQCVWAAPAIGAHTVVALATAYDEAVVFSSRVAFHVAGGFQAAINFQPAGITPPLGYLADRGEPYGNRGAGLDFGWNVSHAADTRLRGGGQDLRRATLCQMRAGGSWEIGVPAGSYHVTIGVGDLGYPSTYTINVEGVSFWNAQLLGAGETRQQTQEIFVADGRLTIDQGAADADETRIAYVMIAASGELPAAPTGLTASVSSANAVALTWTDNSSNEDAFQLERSTGPNSTAASTVMVSLAADQESYLDAGLVPGLTYFYRLRASNSAGASALSNRPLVTLPFLDLDDDGLADVQEALPCLVGVDDRNVDSDRDGYSNQAECLAGTDPLDSRSAPGLMVTGASAGNSTTFVALSFATVTGRHYYIDFADSLSHGVWTMLAGSDRVGDGTVQSVSDIAFSPARQYRLHVLP